LHSTLLKLVGICQCYICAFLLCHHAIFELMTAWVSCIAECSSAVWSTYFLSLPYREIKKEAFGAAAEFCLHI